MNRSSGGCVGVRTCSTRIVMLRTWMRPSSPSKSFMSITSGRYSQGTVYSSYDPLTKNPPAALKRHHSRPKPDPCPLCCTPPMAFSRVGVQCPVLRRSPVTPRKYIRCWEKAMIEGHPISLLSIASDIFSFRCMYCCRTKVLRGAQ